MHALLERDDCLDTLAAAFYDVAAGQGQVVLVSGEAGIGKTALVERFTTMQQEAARVLWGACEALFTPRPLGPLYDLAYQTQGALPVLLEAEADRAAIFAAFLGEVQAGPAPVIVVVEDVHWADEATLDLLKFLGRRIHRAAVLLLLTYRDDELGPDHPLRFVLGDLPSRLTRRLRLSPLSEEAVATLSQQAGRPPGDLHAITGGNPFFVTEVLSGEGRSGKGRSGEGRSGEGRSGAQQRIPATVRDAVLARAARLSPAAREVLGVISVVPGRTERRLLEAMRAPSLDAPSLEALDECIYAGMLRLGTGALSFRHELARRAVEAALSPLRRQALHRQVLEALSGREPPEVARLAYHAREAGDGAAVLRYGPAAARQAAALSAHREAAAHYQTVLQFAGTLSLEEQARFLEGRSYECYLTDQIGEALQARQAALELWGRLNRSLEQGDTLRWMSRLHWFSGHKAEADRYAEEAVRVLEALPPGPELAMAYSNRAHLHMLADETAEAVRWGSQAIELADRFGDTETLVHALNNVGSALLLGGDEAGWDHLEKSLRLAREHGLQEHAARAATNLSSCAVRDRNYARAMDYLGAGIAYCIEHDLDSWLLYMTAWRARALFEQGDWARAAEDAGWVLAQYNVPPITRIPAMAVLGHVRVRRGDPAALPLLDEAQALAMQTAELQRIGPVASARAEAAWLAGAPEERLDEVRACFDLARHHKSPWLLGEMAFWRWRAGDLVEPPEGTAEPYALHMRGHWRAAAAAWRQLGCPYEEALALSDGDPEAQMAALEIFESLGAAPAGSALRRTLRAGGVRGLPRGPRPATRANPMGLTDRQMEVLGLLAEGLTNAEIAERLFISPKTAGHHVSAILAKLDARSRVEAATLALERGLLGQGRLPDGDSQDREEAVPK